MNTTELALLLRDEIRDTAAPYLVSDMLLYSFINDAQKMFCRLTEGIEDGRSFQLSILPTVEWYDLDTAILKLRKATDVATGQEVVVVNMESAALNNIRFDGRPGPIKNLVAGIEKHALRAHPVPNAAATIALDTFRLPVTVAKDDDLEIDEQHHLHLTLWVKHKIFGIEDADLFDRRKADDYEERFSRYCEEARKEQERARRVVGAVAYGGI